MKGAKYTTYLLIAIAVLVGGLLVTRGVTLGKYVSNSVLDYYLNSKGFYFDSDDLSTSVEKHYDTSWDGEEVYFNLKNNSNEKLATEYDIKYKIVCTIEEENTDKKCYLNGTDSDTTTGTLSAVFGCSNYTDDGVDTTSYSESKCTNNDYTWESKPTFSDLYFNVVDTTGKDVDAATVSITATSISPYEKTLSAKYFLTKDKNEIGTLSLKYETYNDYENIIITNSYNENKCLKLNWNSDDLIIDINSNDIVSSKTDENDYINEIIVSVSKKDSINYIFYKRDKEKTYDEKAFTLVETECQ